MSNKRQFKFNHNRTLKDANLGEKTQAVKIPSSIIYLSVALWLI